MKKILYVDMDNVLVDFPSAFPLLSEETLIEYEDRLDEVPHIFSLMQKRGRPIFISLCKVRFSDKKSSKKHIKLNFSSQIAEEN